MTWDLVRPKRNEQDFIQEAERLNFKELVFLYEQPKGVPTSFPRSKVKIRTALLCSNPGRAASLAKKADFICAKLSRGFSETRYVHLLFHAEQCEKPDNVHFRRSEMNQVLAKILTEKSKMYLFDWSTVVQSKEPWVILGRMMQNARLCNKYGVSCAVITRARTPQEKIGRAHV